VHSSGVKVQGEVAAGGAVEVLFGPGQVRVQALRVGDLVWKNRDAALESQLRASYEGLSAAAARKLPVAVAVAGRVGQPLTLTLRDGDGNTAGARLWAAVQGGCGAVGRGSWSGRGGTCARMH
jgi:hypothetical protein